MNKIPLTKKYEVTKHLDNLERHYGMDCFKSMAPLEKFVKPFDPDYLMILGFRNAMGGNYHTGKQYHLNVDINKIGELLTKGYSTKKIAKLMGVSETTIRKRISDETELYELYYGRRG